MICGDLMVTNGELMVNWWWIKKVFVVIDGELMMIVA